MSDSAENAHAILTKLALMERDINEVKAIASSVQACLQDDRTEPGLLTRVDRLEQSATRQKWFHGFWFASIISVIVTWVSHRLGGGT